ncbi:hypothetical protein GV054_15390 [Marinomonas mediterranea]|uniref:hypothetical protein n=1 Tax=Marinomonas mediterranea TaxID=119864 RepID=UPI002349A9A4|nr:hypothetical protein [Marinomonas mediterranea]WCN14274.1 hypothetical protein GV054_15390 [Marinomonas mediterranea]
MSASHWYIKAASACTGQGVTPAQIYAGVQTTSSRVVPCSSLTVNFEGVVTSSLVCPVNDDVIEPGSRCAVLAAQALSEFAKTCDVMPMEGAIALQLGSTVQHDTFMEDLDNALFQLGLRDIGDRLDSLEKVLLNQPEDWSKLEAFEEVIWLSVDSLLNRTSIDVLEDYIANEIYPEGIVPGEASAILWLSKFNEGMSNIDKANMDNNQEESYKNRSYADEHCARLTVYQNSWHRLDELHSDHAEIEPLQHLMVNSVSALPKQQSAWYQWIGRLKLADTQAIEQAPHLWLARSFGYVGVASAGIGVLCALGYLTLPLATTTSAWLVDAQLPQGYHLYKIEQGKQDVK